MTSRSTGRNGGGIDFRREAEEAARAAGLSVDDWARSVFGDLDADPAPPAPTPRATEAPAAAASDPMNRILSSLDRLGDRIRALSTTPEATPVARAANPEPVVRRAVPAAQEIEDKAVPQAFAPIVTPAEEPAAAALPPEETVPPARTSRHAGIDLQQAIEEIARKRDALEKAAARQAAERAPQVPPIDPAEIASLRLDVAAIRQSVETGDTGARLRSLEESYDEVVRRLDQLRGAIDNPRTVADLVQRLAEIRSLLSQAPTDTQVSILADRIEKVDGRLAVISRGEEVTEVSRQIAALAVAVSSLDPAALLGAIDSRLEEVSGHVALLERRLGGLDGVVRLQESVERQATVLSVLAQRSEQVPRIAHEMERQSAVVDGVARHLDQLPDLVTDIAALRGTVDAESLRTTRSLDALIGRIDDLGTRVSEAPTTDHLAAIVEDRISEVVQRLDALHGAIEPGKLRTLDKKISVLAEKLEARIAELATTPLAVELPVELAESLARIEAHLAEDRAAERLSVLEDQIAGLAAAVDGLDRLTPPDIGELELALADVRRHLAVMTPPALGGLEAEVRTLAQAVARIETSPLDAGQIERLDQRIAEIGERLDRRPADGAVLEAAVARFEATLSSALGGNIREDFVALKTELRGAADRDRSLLIAIGDAVERLASASRDVAAPTVAAPAPRRNDGPPVAPPQPEPRAAATATPSGPRGRPAGLADPDGQVGDLAGQGAAWLAMERALDMPDARPSRPTAPFEGVRLEPQVSTGPAADRPLEPGSGKPAGSSDPLRSEPSKADFIAAARRAAQAAAVPPTPAADMRPAGRVKPTTRRSSGSMASGPLRILKTHRRALLAAAAAVVIVVAGGRAAMTFLAERPQWTELAALTGIGASPVVDTATGPEMAGETAIVQTSPDDDSAEPVADAPEDVALAEVPPAAAAPEPSVKAPEPLPVAPAAEPGALATSEPVAPAPGFADGTGQPATNGFSPLAPDASDQTASLPGPSTTAALGSPTLPDGFAPLTLGEAARAGDPAAAFEVAARLTEGRGTQQDLAAAAAWYRKAADSGLPVAQYRLGSLYEKGQGVLRDVVEAKVWYTRAAEAGNAKAMHNLAVLSADGAGGTPDYDAAARWFAAAAENGVRDSQYNLGILYAKGLGVERDLTASYKWFAIAAAGGDADAAKKRDDVAQVLDKDALARARLAVETWRQAPPDPAANEAPAGDPSWAAVPQQTAAVTAVTDPVSTAQALLAQLGYDPGPADGKIGERTRLAIERFQAERGLPVTGAVDEALVQALAEQPI